MCVHVLAGKIEQGVAQHIAGGGRRLILDLRNNGVTRLACASICSPYSVRVSPLALHAAIVAFYSFLGRGLTPLLLALTCSWCVG